MIELAEARRKVLAQCLRLHPRAVALDEALGCVTSVDLTSDEAVPPFANTAVDGFAVRAVDTVDAPVTLPVIATIAAGAPPEPALQPQTAIRILTGAPIPPGADAVVMVEDTDTAGDAVTIKVAAPPNANIRAAGDDISIGQTVFAAGTTLGPAHIGVLASIGVRKVPVFPRARVGVLSTGDELIDDAVPLLPGQIRESNRRMLVALATQANCEPVDLGVARDDEQAISDAIEEGIEGCDAILTSGGVSVGDFDYVKVVLDRLSGGAMQWMQIAIRPAKPFAFGTVRSKPVFGLPGNPVSSLVSFECLARPALRHMMGHHRIDRVEVTAVADTPLRRRADGRINFVRVRAEWVDGGFRVATMGGQGSHQLHATALANALAVVPDGEGVDVGGNVQVLLLGWPD
ncbi:MAG: molybdopterin molybdotransferase MoeA [Acidimicrobiales bacterium]